MTRIASTLAIVLMANTAFAQFEGRIAMTSTNAAMNERSTIDWSLNNGSSRMDISSQANGHASVYSIIADAKGVDMVAKGNVTPVNSQALSAGNFQVIEKLGEETVNGFRCSKYLLTNGKDRVELWASDEVAVKLSDLPFFMRMRFPSADVLKGFPIKMETRDALGQLLATHNVTSVKAEKIGPATFERK